MYLPNLKFVALSDPGVIKRTPNIWAVPGYAHAPFSPKFLKGVVRMDPVNVASKFKVHSFTRSCDNKGYPKNWAVPGNAHALFSPKFLRGFCSHGRCEYTCQI